MARLTFAILLLAAGGLASLRASTDKIFPPDAVINVTLPPYHARPDDDGDDTAAIQQAVRDNVDTGRTLYFPAGTYLISDTIRAKNSDGLWRAHLTFQGQNRDTTILRLIDSAEGYGDPANPKALLATGSHWQEGDGLEGGGNKAFRNNIFDLTLDTGSANPGAVGVDWAVSNQGAIKDVAVRSGDGRGVAGITLLRRIPGPGLIKNVRLTGFDTGLDVGDGQYGLTLENVVVKGQRIAGVRVSQNLLHIRHLFSENSVPTLIVSGRNGVATLLDSRLTGGAPGVPAIDCAGTLLARDVKTEGYTNMLLRGEARPVPDGGEISEPAAIGKPLPPLPIEETPDYWNPDLTDWQAVGPRRDGESDDTAAIQRAVDSGKGTLYLPQGRTYFLSDTVVIRGAVRQVLGMGSEISLGAAEEPFSDAARPRPLFRIDSTASPVVFFENLFFNAQYPGELLFENNSPADVVIKHSAGWVGGQGSRRTYRNTPKATGKLFVEDVFLPGWEFSGQRVWARQFNPENYDGDGHFAQVANHGGTLWILGFKTEGPAPFLKTTAGGNTELLGAYNYISALEANPVPPHAVPYLSENSTMALTFATDNFRDTDYPVYLREVSGGEVTDWKGADLPPRNGVPGDRSFAVPLFRSRAASLKNPATP
jgi:hypothetical protein